MSGTDDRSQLEDLSKRVDKARAEDKSPLPEGDNSGKGAGIALRIATEFVVAVIVGGAIGWYLDDWLGTKPWLMVVFFFLGVGAGFLNVFRAAATISKDNAGEG